MPAVTIASATGLSAAWMSTSGSMIGTSPASRICPAIANCWSSTASMPAWLPPRTSERILVPKTLRAFPKDSSAVEVGNGLHHLDAVGGVGEATVDLQEGDDLLAFPQVVRDAEAVEVALHRPLEQDRGEDVLAGERRAGDDAGAEAVHQLEHRLLRRPGVLAEAVAGERARRAAAGLVEGCNEALAVVDPGYLCVLHGFSRRGAASGDPAFAAYSRCARADTETSVDACGPTPRCRSSSPSSSALWWWPSSASG